MGMKMFRPYRQAGLTLIELMVALVMGLVLLAGVVTVFVANKQTYRVQDALARLQENGRFALAFLERDIRMAGFSGCKNLHVKANTVNNPAGTCPAANPTWDGGEPIYGFNENESAVTSNALGLSPAPAVGSDVLRVLVGGGQGARVIQHKENSAQLKVTAHADLQDFDIVMVVDSNCENGSVFEITNFSNASRNHSEVVHNTGNVSVGPGNCTKDLGQTYLGGRILKLQRAIYYVANTTRNVPALFRTDETGAPQELIEGVENMQVLYGVGWDDSGDGVVDRIDYETAEKVRTDGNWARVVTARVQLLLQSVDANVLWQAQPIDFAINASGKKEYESWDNDYTDKRWRQVYATTVTIRNRVQ
jgi:type IV pilus assembly protein PilW